MALEGHTHIPPPTEPTHRSYAHTLVFVKTCEYTRTHAIYADNAYSKINTENFRCAYGGTKDSKPGGQEATACHCAIADFTLSSSGFRRVKAATEKYLDSIFFNV